MAVVIRLSKMGKRGESRFRVVVKEKRSKRDGREIESLGWYIKTQKGEEKKIDKEKALYWIEKGAKPSKTVSRIIEN